MAGREAGRGRGGERGEKSARARAREPTHWIGAAPENLGSFHARLQLRSCTLIARGGAGGGGGLGSEHVVKSSSREFLRPIAVCTVCVSRSRAGSGLAPGFGGPSSSSRFLRSASSRASSAASRASTIFAHSFLTNSYVSSASTRPRYCVSGVDADPRSACTHARPNTLPSSPW